MAIVILLMSAARTRTANALRIGALGTVARGATEEDEARMDVIIVIGAEGNRGHEPNGGRAGPERPR